MSTKNLTWSGILITFAMKDEDVWWWIHANKELAWGRLRWEAVVDFFGKN